MPDEQEMMMTQKTITKVGFQLNYDDGSGPRAAVSYDSEYKLSSDAPDDRYIKIEGIGGDVLIYGKDLRFVVEALQKIEEVL